MATASRQMAAPASTVWSVLSDGWMYAAWVVGTVKVRDVDDEFPTVGSKLHHAFGAWPVMVKDETEVLECELDKRLRLQARGWPAGEATVELRLSAVDGGTHVEMYEEPTSGPGAWVNNPLIEAVGARRLAESLDRLAGLVESR